MEQERGDKQRLEIDDLVNKLEIRRCMKMDFEDVDDKSLEDAKDSQERIWKLVKEQPNLLPFVVNELVYKGNYFEAMTFALAPDTETFEKSDFLQDETDNLWTSQMIAETLVGIGESVIPYLKDFDNDFAKKAIKKIQDRRLKE